MTFSIGDYTFENNILAAPMAGITDSPFRQFCYKMGAGLTFSEMLSSNPDTWKTQKSALRMSHSDDEGIRAVQILGNDPVDMAIAAKNNVKHGAQIIDINLGCPAKKVNKKLAGSALLQFPERVARIFDAVVQAVDVPVTAKIRTGFDKTTINCVEIARIAENCGIQAITIHGRTRACLFKGEAEYESIRVVKQNSGIPIIANGDITCPLKARQVLDLTGADAIMIGRAAQGRPWIFNEVRQYLTTGELLPAKSLSEISCIVIEHVSKIHQFYGQQLGLRIARKHVSWYLQEYDENYQFRRLFNAIEDAHQQLRALEAFFTNYL